MQNIRLIGGISTYGSPWWWIRFVIGDPGRRIIMRGLRPLPSALPRFWLGHYRMDSSTPDEPPDAFLAQVARLGRPQLPPAALVRRPPRILGRIRRSPGS